LVEIRHHEQNGKEGDSFMAIDKVLLLHPGLQYRAKFDLFAHRRIAKRPSYRARRQDFKWHCRHSVDIGQNSQKYKKLGDLAV
jgi:hypothetical protein